MNWTKLLQMRRVLRLRRLTPWARLQLMMRLPSMVRLSLALFRDNRVPLPTRAIAGAALTLVVSPLNLPEFIPVVGQAWDIALIALILEFFIENCPSDVVREHVARLGLQDKFTV